MKRYMCLGFPNWPIQRLWHDRPEWRDRPMILHRRDPRRGLLVRACCRRARRQGVRIGMPLVEATALAPEAISREHAPAEELHALAELAERCEAFSPRVGWATIAKPAEPEIDPSPGHLFLDVTGMTAVFGDEAELARQAVAACRLWGYFAHVALADTVGAAWALATSGAAMTIVPEGGLAAALEPLAVESLRLPGNEVELLARLGVRTVGQLRRLSRVGLAERFGPGLLACLDRALGSAEELLLPHRPEPEFRGELELDPPTDRRDFLERALGHLTDGLSAELQSAGRGAVRLEVELALGRQQVAEFGVGLYRPTDQATALQELLRLQLDRLTLAEPVDRVRLRAEPTIRLRPEQAELFDDPARSSDRALAALVERLSGRLGPEAVVRPVWRDDPLPERAYEYRPWIGRGRGGRESQPAWLGAAHHRPLRLFVPPIPVRVVGDPPQAFEDRGERQVLGRAWGPERIETGWWRKGLVRRDYFRVETLAGRRFWLFRDLIEGRWYLHGSFE